MIGIYDGSFFECCRVDIHKKVEFGVPISPHVSVEEVDVCLVYFFSLFYNCVADFVLEFFCVEFPLLWGKNLVRIII